MFFYLFQLLFSKIFGLVKTNFFFASHVFHTHFYPIRRETCFPFSECSLLWYNAWRLLTRLLRQRKKATKTGRLEEIIYYDLETILLHKTCKTSKNIAPRAVRQQSLRTRMRTCAAVTRSSIFNATIGHPRTANTRGHSADKGKEQSPCTSRSERGQPFRAAVNRGQSRSGRGHPVFCRFVFACIVGGKGKKQTPVYTNSFYIGTSYTNSTYGFLVSYRKTRQL